MIAFNENGFTVLQQVTVLEHDWSPITGWKGIFTGNVAVAGDIDAIRYTRNTLGNKTCTSVLAIEKFIMEYPGELLWVFPFYREQQAGIYLLSNNGEGRLLARICWISDLHPMWVLYDSTCVSYSHNSPTLGLSDYLKEVEGYRRDELEKVEFFSYPITNPNETNRPLIRHERPTSGLSIPQFGYQKNRREHVSKDSTS